MLDFYILIDRKPVAISFDEYVKWRSDENNKRVAFDRFGDVDISTVFLCHNHGGYCGLPDLWFETMVFGGKLDQEQDRYETWEEAEAGHAAMVARVKAEEN